MKSLVRIEHPSSGLGIFQHEEDDFFIDFFCPELPRKHSNFPGLYGDEFIWKGYDDSPSKYNCYCGFLSIEQLNE